MPFPEEEKWSPPEQRNGLRVPEKGEQWDAIGTGDWISPTKPIVTVPSRPMPSRNVNVQMAQPQYIASSKAAPARPIAAPISPDRQAEFHDKMIDNVVTRL